MRKLLLRLSLNRDKHKRLLILRESKKKKPLLLSFRLTKRLLILKKLKRKH
jgi:hypothetical protein